MFIVSNVLYLITCRQFQNRKKMQIYPGRIGMKYTYIENTAAKKDLTRDCFNWEMTQMSWCFSEPIKICVLINEP